MHCLTPKIILFLLCTSIALCVYALLLHSFIHYTQKHVFRAYCISGTLLGTEVRVGSKLRSVSQSYEAQSL